MFFSQEISDKSAAVLDACRAHGLKLALAESCTGGMLATCFTDHTGVSDVFMGCAVTYANEAKNEVLNVDNQLIVEHGAVSEQVARAMAAGACARFNADIAVSITGIAGPGGGGEHKPIGTVDIATAFRGKTAHRRFLFDGKRHAVRLQAVEAALGMLLAALRQA